MKKLKLLITCVFCVAFSAAQSIDLETKTSVILNDNTEVILYGKLINPSNKNSNAAVNNEFYYLPPSNSLRLTKAKNGQDQFSLIKYAGNTEELSVGGILYFTMEFGLTKDQELEVKEKLKQKYPNAKVKGSVELMPEVGKASGEFNVLLIKTGGSTSTLSKSTAPIGQGGKLAVMANLSRLDVELVEEILKGNSGLGGIYVELRYTYPVRVPGFTGTLTFNQEKYQSVKEKFTRTGSQGGYDFGELLGGSRPSSIEDIRKFYNYLDEENVIEAVTETSQYIDKESAKELEKGFFNYFFETFAQPVKLETNNQRSSAIDSVANSEYGYGANFTLAINDSTTNNLNRRSESNLNHRTFYRFPCGFGDDIKTVLQDINIEDHIHIVNFDDPLFAWRYVNVSLNGELPDLIGGEIDAIEVKLRKQKGNSEEYFYFEDQKPIIFNQKGEAVQIRTYNKSHDPKGKEGIFEYKTIISYKNRSKEKSGWKKGEQDALVITSKLQRRDIEFESDIDELADNRVAKVILQIRYKQLGKEKTTNVNLSVRSSEASKMKTIFMDDNKKSYSTRLVYIHKDFGQIVTEWKEEDYSSDSVYGIIPEKIREFTRESISAYKEATNFKFTETRNIQNPDGTLKKEIKDEAADVFGNN